MRSTGYWATGVGSWPRSFWPPAERSGESEFRDTHSNAHRVPTPAPFRATGRKPYAIKVLTLTRPRYPRWHAGRTGAGFSGVAPGAPTAPAGASAVRSPGRLAATGPARIFLLLRPGAGARPGGEVMICVTTPFAQFRSRINRDHRQSDALRPTPFARSTSLCPSRGARPGWRWPRRRWPTSGCGWCSATTTG